MVQNIIIDILNQYKCETYTIILFWSLQNFMVKDHLYLQHVEWNKLKDAYQISQTNLSLSSSSWDNVWSILKPRLVYMTRNHGLFIIHGRCWWSSCFPFYWHRPLLILLHQTSWLVNSLFFLLSYSSHDGCWGNIQLNHATCLAPLHSWDGWLTWWSGCSYWNSSAAEGLGG